MPTPHAVREAFVLFLALHEAPTGPAAEELIRWLQENTAHVYALDEALTLWALAGAALLKNPDTKAVHRIQ